MKPLNSLILVEYEEPSEKKTDSGLYVPPAAYTITANDFLKEGTVLKVNPEEKHIKEGDKVYFNINARVKVPQHDNMLLVRSEDIYLVK